MLLMEKIVKSSPGIKLFVCVSTVAIIAFGTYSWIVSPQISYLKAAESYEWMTGNAGQKGTTIEKGIGSKQQEIAALAEEIDQIQDSFFTEEKAREFFSDLEPISLQSNCNIDTLAFLPAETIGSETDNEHTTSIILKRAEISLIGQYENIIKFLKKLSSYSQRVSIGNLQIQSDHFGQQELSCYMTVTIYLIEDKEKVKNE
jgi:Tfp pilus assembly protein PilO